MAQIGALVAQYSRGWSAVIRKLWFRRIVWFVAPATICLLLFAGWRNWSEVPLLVGLLLAASLLLRARSSIERFRQDARDRLLPELFGFVDNLTYRHGEASPATLALRQTGMTRHDVADCGDSLSGTYQGASFSLDELTLDMGTGAGAPSFRGFVLHTALQAPFPGILMARQRQGVLGCALPVEDRFGTKLTRVRPDGSAMAEGHEFLTDNPEAGARVIGDLSSALAFLEETRELGSVHVLLRDESCCVLVPTKRNFFELPNTYVKMREAEVLPMISDFASLALTARLMSRLGQRRHLPLTALRLHSAQLGLHVVSGAFGFERKHFGTWLLMQAQHRIGQTT
ncbi:hypothetical protein [Sinorhizobium sp. A49]|uniref:hypothetical protein n=1 Tax=Sinorhizobium sp. A49 TaxID=1945861 RepID=UPI00111580C5|nr:hypothetical protein [Sinorhizobium sp. A49]